MSLTINRPVHLVKTLSLFHGEEWLSWSPMVLRGVLERHFDYHPDDLEYNRVEALREVLRSDRFLKNPLLFEKLIRSLNSLPFTDAQWEPVSPPELAFGMYAIERISGDGKLGEAGHGVLAYIASVLAEGNIGLPVPELGFDLVEKEMAVASQIEPQALDDAKRIWAHIVEGYASQNKPFPPSDEFTRRVRAVVQAFVKGEGLQSDDTDSRDFREAVARHIVAILGVWLYLAKRDAAPEAPVATSPAAKLRRSLNPEQSS
jgi:hypothetical protein